MGDPGTVHQDVQPTTATDRAPDELVAKGAVGDLARHELALPAGADNLVAHRRTDAGGRVCHQSHIVGEVEDGWGH